MRSRKRRVVFAFSADFEEEGGQNLQIIHLGAPTFPKKVAINKKTRATPKK